MLQLLYVVRMGVADADDRVAPVKIEVPSAVLGVYVAAPAAHGFDGIERVDIEERHGKMA